MPAMLMTLAMTFLKQVFSPYTAWLWQKIFSFTRCIVYSNVLQYCFGHEPIACVLSWLCYCRMRLESRRNDSRDAKRRTFTLSERLIESWRSIWGTEYHAFVQSKGSWKHGKMVQTASQLTATLSSLPCSRYYRLKPNCTLKYLGETPKENFVKEWQISGMAFKLIEFWRKTRIQGA